MSPIASGDRYARTGAAFAMPNAAFVWTNAHANVSIPAAKVRNAETVAAQTTPAEGVISQDANAGTPARKSVCKSATPAKKHASGVAACVNAAEYDVKKEWAYAVYPVVEEEPNVQLASASI